MLEDDGLDVAAGALKKSSKEVSAPSTAALVGAVMPAPRESKNMSKSSSGLAVVVVACGCDEALDDGADAGTPRA